MKARSWTEFQGYEHEDFCPASYSGYAETLPVPEPKGKIIARNKKRQRKSFVVRGFR